MLYYHIRLVLSILHNDTDEWMDIVPQERIAQLVVMPYLPVDFEVVDELSDIKRGDGGFGSTGQA